MGYASKEALLEYTQTKKSNSMFFKFLGVGALIMGLLILLMAPSDSFADLILPLAMIAGGIYFFFADLTGNSAYQKYIKLASSTGELQRIINDFAASQSLADDRIRLGAEYIYGKNMGRPLSYAELRKVYPYIVTGSSCARYLKGVTADGAEHLLCEFIVKRSQKDPHPDESYIYQVIVTKNPNVYLGYK